MWKYLSLFVCIPVVALTTYVNFGPNAVHHHRPEFAPYEYMRIRAQLFSESFKYEYKSYDKIKIGYIYIDISKGFYRLPHADTLAKKVRKERIAPQAYFAHTLPGYGVINTDLLLLP